MYESPEMYDDAFTAPLDDELIAEHDLERILDPWLPQPDHRILEQTRYLPLPDGKTEDLESPRITHPMPYMALLQASATHYHAMAAAWEGQTTSTAARLLWLELGVRTIADTHPLVWLESTPMMRALRAWAGDIDREHHVTARKAKNRYTDSVDPFALPEPGEPDSAPDE